MEVNQEDINSLFDCIALSEDRLVGEGYEKWYREGLKEGERLWRLRGGKIGAEIGFLSRICWAVEGGVSGQEWE